MRRSTQWPGLALVLGVGLVGIGTVSAQAPEAPTIRGEVVRLGEPVRFDWDDARRVDARLRMLGVLDALAPSPVAAAHPSLPVPSMPMPHGFAPPPPALDLGPVSADTFSFDAPPVVRSFKALGDNGSSFPPDTHGAVGQAELMTTLNTQVRRQDRLGAPVSTLSLYGFWFTANSSTVSPTDPRVRYDPDPNPAFGGLGRWITVASDAAGTPPAALLIAVSQTSAPSSWHAWRIPASAANLPASGVWFDSPNVGFNGKWIVVQVNVLTYTVPPTAPTLVESRIYVFDKAALYAGSLVTTKVFTLVAGTWGGSQVPALTYDLGANDLHFLQVWNVNSAGYGHLKIYELSGSVGSETLVDLPGMPSAPAWSDSALNMQDFAPQGTGCGTNKIQTNDSRIQSVVERNGKLWATHTVFFPAGGTPARASVQWWQVQTDGTVVQSGLVDDTSNARFYAFPSLAVNKNEDVMLGFSSFEGNDKASARYAFRLKTDPPGFMQVPTVLKDGEACYFKDGGLGRNRWGDQSATVVDPTDDTKMWTLQEYAAATNSVGTPTLNVWGTWWGLVDPTPVVAITDASLPAEGDSGTTMLTFDVSLRTFDLLQPQPTSQEVTVNWTTGDDTARTDTDADYVPASGTVVFAPGETAKTIQVAVKGDLKKEPTERFFVNLVLQAPGNATLPDAQAVGTIFDDDPDPLISIGDVHVSEGTGGGSTTASFAVTLSNPSAMTVTVDYKTTADSAVSPADFNAITTTTLSFAPGQTLKTIGVTIVRDSVEEASEDFYVDLVAPVVGGSIQKPRGTGVILDDDAPLPGIGDLTVVSDGTNAPLTGRNRLQWVNPTTGPIVVRIKWNKSAGTCTYPDPMNESASADFSEDLSCTVTCPNTQPYGGLVLNESYCHTVYLGYAGNTWSQGVKALGRPFDASPGQSVKWKYFVGEGVATLAAPTIGSHGVLVPSNDFRVHSMARGALGGTWPVAPDWTPVNLGSPAQTRSPIVDIGGVPRMYLTTLDGWVHAIDARTGAKMWETQIGTTGFSGGGAAPAGIFTAFGGAWDYILVGTRQASGNRFYALHPDTGAVIDYYPKAGELPVGAVEMGAVTAMASVDYARRQVYFATFAGPTHSLWCLRLGPSSNALRLGWAHQKLDNAPSPGIPGLGEIDGSPVLRPDGTRLYVGNTSGRLWSIDPVDGTILSSFDAAPGGNVNGFPYPDRRNRDVYFVTTASFPGDNIWAVTDNVTTGLGLKWKTTASNPSTPLVSTVTDRLYVGSNLVGPGGGVREYALTDGTNTNSVQLTPGPMVIGAPSLDTQALPKSLLHVGSVDGVFYAVEVPF